jgi:hypothetical protein
MTKKYSGKKGKERERRAINNTKQQNWEIYKCARKARKFCF